MNNKWMENYMEYTIMKHQSIGEETPNITTSSSLGDYHKHNKEMVSDKKEKKHVLPNFTCIKF